MVKAMKDLVPVLTLLVLALAGLSCDRGGLSLAKKNFVWTEKPTDPFYAPVEGWYYNTGDHYHAVLGWRCIVRPGGTPLLEYVVLCFDRHPCGTTFIHDLTQGAAIEIFFPGPERPRVFVSCLNGECFTADRISEHKMRVAYNGKAILERGQGTDLAKYRSWLRFDVMAKEDKNKVASIVGELRTLFKQGGIAEVGECLSATPEN